MTMTMTTTKTTRARAKAEKSILKENQLHSGDIFHFSGSLLLLLNLLLGRLPSLFLLSSLLSKQRVVHPPESLVVGASVPALV
jgi:hypothetical protein